VDTTAQPCVDVTEDKEMTQELKDVTNEYTSQQDCEGSNQEPIDHAQDAVATENALPIDAEPAVVAEAVHEAPGMQIDETQPAAEHPGENQAIAEVTNDSGTCMDEKLDEGGNKHEAHPETLKPSSKNDKIGKPVEISEKQECEVAALSVSATEKQIKEARKPIATMVSEEETQTEPPSPTFRKERQRKMSIRRLSDAFIRSKFPSPVDNTVQEVNMALNSFIRSVFQF
jgi:hypothetical protein